MHQTGGTTATILNTYHFEFRRLLALTRRDSESKGSPIGIGPFPSNAPWIQHIRLRSYLYTFLVGTLPTILSHTNRVNCHAEMSKSNRQRLYEKYSMSLAHALQGSQVGPVYSWCRVPMLITLTGRIGVGQALPRVKTIGITEDRQEMILLLDDDSRSSPSEFPPRLHCVYIPNTCPNSHIRPQEPVTENSTPNPALPDTNPPSRNLQPHLAPESLAMTS